MLFILRKIVFFVKEIKILNIMYGKMKEYFSNMIVEIKEVGFYKEECLIESV